MERRPGAPHRHGGSAVSGQAATKVQSYKVKIARLVLFCILLPITTACTAPVATPSPVVGATVEMAGLTLPAGYSAEVVVEGLLGPTQMIWGPEERLWVAQLAGAENASQGQVVAIDLASGAQSVLLDGLLKPVGIAVLDGYLWIAARNDLLRAPIAANGEISALETVLSDLPFNGRSIGALTVTPQGRLLYETSGARTGNEAAPGSAVLWELDPADPANPANPQPLARGLKNAYAHAFDPVGRLWITEVADDMVNGEAPPDELNLWAEGADFGWPQCYGLQEPARNYGGDETICAQTRAAVATFAPRATPTSVVASPWEENVLLVALWVQGIVVRVPVTFAGDNASGAPETFISGLQNPQHLLVTAEGGLLVSDFSAGKVYRIQKGGD